MNIKWNEDKTEATISKADLESLQSAPTENFNKGFGKGKEEGQKTILKKFEFLEIDADNVDDKIKEIKTVLTNHKDGKLISADKVSDKDGVIGELQTKLDKKDNALKDMEKQHTEFRKKTLIDSRLIALGASKDHKAVNPEQTAQIFKMSYLIDLDKNDSIVLKNLNGSPIMDEKANDLPLENVYAMFAKNNLHLFEATQGGGSGGGDGSHLPPGASLKDLKSDEQKAAFIKEHGFEEYKKLVDAEAQTQDQN